MATLVANTVVSDATGNVFIPLDAGPQADTDVTVIASAAVQIQAEAMTVTSVSAWGPASSGMNTLPVASETTVLATRVAISLLGQVGTTAAATPGAEVGEVPTGAAPPARAVGEHPGGGRANGAEEPLMPLVLD